MSTSGETTRVAVIGAGNMASEHIRVFQDLPDVEIVGIHGRTRTRAEQFAARHGVSVVCDSIRELYEVTQAHLVVVAVSELEANAVSLSCFEYPWTVLLEKPAGYNLSDASDIEAVARLKKRPAYVALNRRHYSSTRVARDDLREVADQRFIVVQDQEDPMSALRVGKPKAVVDHWMYANSIHLIDYFRIFGRGEVLRVEPIIPWNPDDPRFVVAQIVFSSGDIGLYEAIWNGPGPWAVTISTQKKRWELRPLEQASMQPYGSRKLETLPSHRWDSDFKPGLRLQAEEAIKAVQGLPHALPTLAEGLESIRLIKAIYQR